MCRTPRAPTRRTLPVQALVHAFHCQDPSCQITTCANTKRVLGRMEAHVQGCRQEVGGTDECKVCKLWQALHRTRGNGNPRRHPRRLHRRRRPRRRRPRRR